MMTATVDGVKAATDADKRYTIACIHLANPNYDAPRLVHLLSRKTPSEMHHILAAPDVNVTNAKDKEILLPVVSATNERVKERMAVRGPWIAHCCHALAHFQHCVDHATGEDCGGRGDRCTRGRFTADTATGDRCTRDGCTRDGCVHANAFVFAGVAWCARHWFFPPQRQE